MRVCICMCVRGVCVCKCVLVCVRARENTHVNLLALHKFCGEQPACVKLLRMKIKKTCSLVPRSGELRTQKLKSHLVRTQSLNVLPLKPGVGQYIAIHATLTARDFFRAYFYTSGPFTCIFPKPLPNFACVGCD